MEELREKKKAFISAVIYVHNCEKEQLIRFCGQVLKTLQESFENMEVVFVIDGHEKNPDQRQIQDMMRELVLDMTTCVVQLPYYQGIEAALSAGDDLAVGDFVFEFDDISADFDNCLLDKAYDRIKDGFDIVSVGDDSMKFTSRFFYSLINRGKQQKIHHETFRIVSRRALNRIKILNKTVPYRKMLYASCGLPGDFISYHSDGKMRRKHSSNEKNYRLDAGFKYMIIFTRVIERITMLLSTVFLLTALGTGAWALYDHFYGSNIAGGWVSLMAVISFGFFGLFLLVTVIIKYLSLLVDVNYKKASYVVEQVEKI